jgi:cation diffusion facilitator family transporter
MTSPTGNGAPHDHTFGQDLRRPGERRTLLVIAITATMMVIEIVAGMLFGSMALLADGLHMASHAAALAVTAAAYVYARRKAGDPSFSFGTGKVNALAGFASGLLLVSFALIMVVESVERFLDPVTIRFEQAILVAVLGLLVNAISAVILGHSHGDSGHHPPGHDHGHSHGHSPGHEQAMGHGHAHHHDHNLRAAYLHVLADALTSILAIGALLAGRLKGWVWLDPAMGIVGAALITRWSIQLASQTSDVLLDRQAPAAVREGIRMAIEDGTADRVTDLHVWSIGPGIRAATLTVVSPASPDPDEIRARLPAEAALVHTIVEIHRAAE